MITQPHEKQHPSVKKAGLTARKLEKVSKESLLSWFEDPDCYHNGKKRKHLEDIFAVAKAEERYLK